MSDRRKFLQQSSLFAAGMLARPAVSFANKHHANTDTLNVALIGLGQRGLGHLNNLMRRDDVDIAAICDIDQQQIRMSLEAIDAQGKPKPEVFGKDDLDYRNLLELSNVDAVIIATPWLWHTRMAVDSMEAGKYTGLEVSAANTIEECWDLVNTHEESGSHLMILENVNYRRDVLAVLNMVKQNVFGELLHFRCGYQHDLRGVMFNDGKTAYGKGVEFGEKGFSESAWRTQHSLHRNADVYPTHGLGPVAVMADVNRGNRFMSMTSHATKGVGLNKYIVDNAGPDHPNAKLKFVQGDVITSTINTAKGETIMVTHNVNTPRPYSLDFRVQGAMGVADFDYHTQRIHVEGTTEGHGWDDMKPWLEKYDHPLWKEFGDYASGAGHGGIDFFVLNAFVESAKANVAPPMDAYDAAAWSAVTPLSELSIANGGEPQDFPDFTRGRWINRPPYAWDKNNY